MALVPNALWIKDEMHADLMEEIPGYYSAVLSVTKSNDKNHYPYYNVTNKCKRGKILP